MPQRSLFVASLLVLACGSFAACSSDDAPPTGGNDDDAGTSSSSSGSGNGSSSSSSSSGGGSSSGGSSSGDGGSSGSAGPACYAPASAVGWTTQTQVSGSNDCTSEQIAALWSACAGDDVVVSACTAASTAAAGCFACLTGAGSPSERVSGFLSFEGGVHGINDVCEANAIGQAEECGSKRDNQDSCLVGGCSECFETADNEPCQDAALAGPCAQYVPGVDCDALLEDDDNVDLFLEKCGDLQAAEVSEEDYLKAALYMCGPPPG